MKFHYKEEYEIDVPDDKFEELYEKARIELDNHTDMNDAWFCFMALHERWVEDTAVMFDYSARRVEKLKSI